MGSIPGAQLSITGASGSQGLLAPRQSWRIYVFPRGAHAAQDSTGTLITFDSAAVALRFAAGNWVQVGLSTDNIRRVSAVGGNSISVLGSALTVSENNRVFLIGNTQPTVSGGSATYTIPNTLIRQRDDDGSDLYTNSMVTSNADGLVQFFSEVNVYDVLIQDGNQSNQGSVIDLSVGAVEGISTSSTSLFGATVTINANVGVTGSLVLSGTLLVGQTATFNATVGVTGTLLVGQTATFNAAVGVTGWATFGQTVTFNAAIGITGTATFGSTLTVAGNATFGSSAVFADNVTISGTTTRLITGRLSVTQGTTLTVASFVLGASWGTGSTITLIAGLPARDAFGSFRITSGSAALGAFPTVTMTFVNAALPAAPVVFTTFRNLTSPAEIVPAWAAFGTSQTATFWFQGTPSVSQVYDCSYLIIGRS